MAHTADREAILAEICRTAAANGGVALGKGRFAAATGISQARWSGVYRARRSDAVREAGFVPNRLQPAFPDDHLLGKMAELARELGRWPVSAEQRLKNRQDKSFPNIKAFERFGGKADLQRAAADYCHSREGWEDVPALIDVPPTPTQQTRKADTVAGSVYMLKAGKHYKIGRSNAVGRREREIALQLPERARLVHTINTDDPPGIEQYWHQRFAAKRANGEWFALNAEDVSAFRRRKFM